MARLATPSANREAPPPNPPGGTAKARVTRSQSQDLGDDNAAEIGRQNIRRSSRHTSVDSVASAASQGSKSNRRRKANRAAETIPELSMVEEAVEDDQDQQDEPDPYISKSIPITSEAPRTSQSETPATESQELSDLSPDLIIETLPSLYEFSSGIIKQIPANIIPKHVAEIRNLLATSNSKLAKRMRDFGLRLEASKGNFGDGVFINNDLILQKLFGIQDPDIEFGRPDSILHKANIAILFKTILVKEPQVELVEILDEAFPALFTSAYYMEGYDEKLQDTFDLALEIRTQLTILILQNFQGRENFDPDTLIAQIFYQGDEEISAERILKEGRPRNIAGLDLEATEAQSNKIAERINEIRLSQFDDTQAHATREYVDLDELRSKFPWDGFLSKMIQWLHQRADEHDNAIEQDGGLEKIVEALLGAIPDPEDEITLHFTPEPAHASELSPPNSAKAESAAEKKKRITMAAKEINKQSLLHASAQPPELYKSKSISTTLATTQKTLSKRVPEEHLDGEAFNASGAHDDLEVGQASSPPDIKKINARWSGIEKEKNKENNRPIGDRSKKSFLDRQVNARKARFDDDEDEDEDEIPVEASKPHRKRTQKDVGVEDESEIVQETEEEDPSEDEGFEEDMRDRNSRRRDGRSATQTSSHVVGSSSKRQRMQAGSSGTRKPSSEPANNSRSRRPEVAEDFGEEDMPPVPIQPYKDINAEAKRQVALNKARNTQTRVPWTSAECEALIELIGEHGNGWSTMSQSAEARDSIQERHRDQVALKDKARNIKVDYLISGSPLPLNFDLIKLGQKEKDKVIKAGFNPYRREGEEVGEEGVDENGEPYE